MTVRIKFTIDEGGTLGSSAGKVSRTGNSINIKLAVLNNVTIQNEADNHLVNLENNYHKQIKELEIFFQNEVEARKVYGLLHLKHKLKDGKPWDFLINGIQHEYAELDQELSLNRSTHVLSLNTNEFGNDLNNIDISKINFIEGLHSSPFYGNDFKKNRAELYKLEDLLTNLENKYLSASTNLQNSVNELNELENYSGGVSIKQDLFDLRDSPGKTSSMFGVGSGDPHIFRGRINKLIRDLKEFAVWSSPQIGFTNIEQILKANANGFIIAQRGEMKPHVTIGGKDPSGILIYEIGDEYLSLGTPNVKAILETLEGGKYRGFPIIDPAQPSPQKIKARKFKTLFGFSCQEGEKQFTKTHIDEFRDFIQKNMGSDGGKETNKQKCFGFEITDINQGRYQGRSGCKARVGTTKISYDIWAAPSLEAAIDLAFFGKPYAGMKNVDKSLLFLNEVEGKSRKEILDIYLNEGLKNEMCGRSIYLAIVNDWQTTSPFVNENSEKKVNEVYEIVEKWATTLDYYEKNYPQETVEKNQAKLLIGELENLKIKAKADEESYEWMLVEKWKSKIEEVINAFKTVTGKIPNNNDLPADVLNKIRGYRASETNTQAQKVYEEAEKMKSADNITGETIEKLKELVELIKNTSQSSSFDTLVKLKNFSSAQPNSEAGKAWVIAKKVTDATGKVWVEEALKKCQTAALADAHSKLKRAVGSENIYQQIVTSIEKDAIAVSQATEIFNWAKQSLAIKGTDETQEVKELKSKLQTAQSHTSAWNAVNNYKENSSDTEGYATKAYKKIQSFSEKRQETVDKSHLAEAKNEEELSQFYQRMKKGKKFTGSLKETVEKKSYPRAQIIAMIREKGDSAKPEEKTLVELVKDFVTKAEIDTDFGSDLDRTNYQILKDKQKSLAKYTETGTSENNIFKSFRPEQKQVIIELVSELSKKVEKMKKSIEQEDRGREDSSNNSEEPFYKTTSGIIIISISGVLVLSLAFWVFAKVAKKKKKS